jgi:hypothetical protein
MSPTPNHVTHDIKYQALITSKIIPRRIANKGNINKRNAEITCLTVFEIFISMINHIFIDDLLPLLKMCYISLSIINFLKKSYVLI